MYTAAAAAAAAAAIVRQVDGNAPLNDTAS